MSGARRFGDALLEQRGMRLKGGIYHLTQIQLAFHSNRIEGGHLSEEQTRYIYETQTVIGDAPVNDVIETDNHFRAFDAALAHVGQPITARTLWDYHRRLKEHTTDSRKNWFSVGGWKSAPNEVGGKATTPPDEVDAAIEKFISETSSAMRFEDIVDWHVRFERIHPFQDGNGRIGRLVMFEQCLTHGVMPFVIPDEAKTQYFRGLADYDDDPVVLQQLLRNLQAAYAERFEAFIPRG